MKFIHVDASNLFFRIKHAVRGDADTKGAMAVHVCFQAIAKVYHKFEGTHVVFALEGFDNWREKELLAYKAHRKVEKNMRTQREKEDDDIFFEYMNAFSAYLDEKSNVSVLQVRRTEADDVIARWIQLHPDDDHVIISNDSDFFQLLAPNVTIYRAQTNETVTLDSIVDDDGQYVIDKKTNKHKPGPNPEWELFKKILRGDAGDGVGRACLKGMRETKLKEAFDNRIVKGFDWNNVMLQEWEDPDTGMRSVESRYKENQKLIDLSRQPDDIKLLLGEAIIKAADTATIPASKIGFGFMKFCDEYDLSKLAQNPSRHTDYLKAGYGESLARRK